MGERNSPSLGFIIARKSLIFLFITISILFVLSWFFILRSTDQTRVLDYVSIPEPNRITQIIDNSNVSNQNDAVPSTGNRSILANKEQPRETETVKEKKDDETFRSSQKVSRPRPLKIFMYDMSPEFHFGLLDWTPEKNDAVWPVIKTNIPRYPGGLNLQHSVEYWLTLDLLFSELPEASYDGSRAAVRVRNSSEADVIFVPFFSSLSYNRLSKVNQKQRRSRDKELQEKVVKFVTSQREWKISGGRDHVVIAHHPNSMLGARNKLFPAIFVLADFGRYSPRVANIEKDVVAPYKHVVKSYVNDTLGFDSRPILLYFQGAIYRKDGGFVRQELYYLLKDEKDVHFSFGSVRNHGINKAGDGMRSSKFCFNIAGDTPSSNRLFDAIASHCVPVIISDEIELPYEDVLNYNEFCLFVRTSDALKKNFLVNFVRSVGREEWTRMWRRLKKVERHFEFRFPSADDDAVQMIWRAVARKVPGVKKRVHRSLRFKRSIRGSDTVGIRRNFG